MDKLTMGSLFDGSGGFPLGALINGITPVWASEIEPFPIRVTTKRLPFMKHYGDIRKINGAEIEPVDIITFGSPCTNMSVAGKREGLNGEQSVLFYQAIRIIKEMRCATNGRQPRFCVWENVPGAYSSSGGSDFREVLTEIVKIKDEGLSVPMPESGKWLPPGEIVGDGFSVAFRCIDAQFWGVAQRRRRCYLVADFSGEGAGKILFEFESLSGYTPQGFSQGQGTAADAQGGARAAGGADLNGRQPLVFEPGAVSRLGGHAWDDVTGALRADMGDNQLSVAIPINTQIATRYRALGEGTGFGVGEGNDPAFTLQAAHSHAVAAGFIGGQGQKAGSIGCNEEISPTIRGETGGNATPGVLAPDRAVAALESHPQDSRVKLDKSGTMQTLTSNMGLGGGNVPLVMNERQLGFPVTEDIAQTLLSTDYKGAQCVFEYSPQTLKIRSGCEKGGGKGALLQDNKSATLSRNNDQTVFVPFRKSTRPHNKDEGQKWEQAETANTLNTFDTGETRCNELAVKVYGICSDASNSMRSDNPASGIYEADTSRTLDRNGGNPANNQGGMAVVALQGSMIGRKPENGPQGNGIGENISFTLTETDKHAVAYDCRNHAASGVSATIQAKNNGGQSLNYINPVAQAGLEYIIRRLTPQECAALQGFPIDWCANLETPEPSEADIAWWSEVFETHRKVVGTSGKPKSRGQIIKWLQNPHSDSAEYKMWGNGVALPCVCFVMAGIAWAAGRS